MSGEENVETTRRMFEAHNQGAEVLLERFDEFFDPDVEWTPVVVGGLEGRSYVGREGWRRWYAERDEALENSAVEIISCEAVAEDVVLLLGRNRARGRVSGYEVDVEVGLVLEFKDGRIARDRAFGSHAEARERAQHA